MRPIELTADQILEALHDVAENGGHMCAPVADDEIVARWRALRAAGYVRLINGRNGLTKAGRTALKEASSHAD